MACLDGANRSPQGFPRWQGSSTANRLYYLQFRVHVSRACRLLPAVPSARKKISLSRYLGDGPIPPQCLRILQCPHRPLKMAPREGAELPSIFSVHQVGSPTFLTASYFKARRTDQNSATDIAKRNPARPAFFAGGALSQYHEISVDLSKLGAMRHPGVVSGFFQPCGLGLPIRDKLR